MLSLCYVLKQRLEKSQASRDKNFQTMIQAINESRGNSAQNSHRTIKYGVLEDDMVRVMLGTPYTYFRSPGKSLRLTERHIQLEQVRLLAPCLPSKIVALGLNYRSHAKETKLQIPSLPLIFLKPSTAVIGPEDKIIYPQASKGGDYEGELAVVIGRKVRAVDRAKAREYILGYTCFNDVSARYEQRDGGQWTRAKSYDTFAPIGPYIVTDISRRCAAKLYLQYNDAAARRCHCHRDSLRHQTHAAWRCC